MPLAARDHDEDGARISTPRGRKALIVDDSMMMRRIVKAMVAAVGITDVIESDNGRTALEQIRNGGIGVVVMDLVLSGESGLDLIQAIRGDPALHSVPVIVVTEVCNKAAVLQAITAGVNAYFLRPFHQEAFQTRVRHILGPGP
jgi:two-component system chemotaxis response regulator CheY